MKKTYLAPSILVIDTVAEEVICTSGEVKGAFTNKLTVGANDRDSYDDDDEDLW